MTDDQRNPEDSPARPDKWEAVARAIAAADAATIDTESALRSVKARIAGLPGRQTKMFGLFRSDRGVNWRIMAPAMAAGALLAVAFPTFVSRRGDSPQVIRQTAQIFESHVGQRNTVKLSDGTKIVLGPATRLVVAPDYGDKSRDVDLAGEAFFEVVHDSQKPFTVHANGVAIQDIGTMFSVRGDNGTDLTIAVTEGSVSFSTQAGGKAVLRGGDQSWVKPNGEVATRRGTVTNDDISWMIGKLSFREASIPEVAASLRRWYGIEFKVTDPALSGRHITASFSGESADRVLEVIGLALGADIERKGDTAVVRSSKRQSQ